MSPAYLQAYDDAAGSAVTTFGNRLVAKSEVFSEYSEWLFSVLRGYDAMKERRGEPREPRVDGYLSELLLNVWVSRNLSENDVFRCPSFHTEAQSLFDPYGGGVFGAAARFAYTRPSMLERLQLIATFGRRMVS